MPCILFTYDPSNALSENLNLELAGSHTSEIVAKLDIINDSPGSRKAGVLVEVVRG